ncbi:uncharacterized protein LOC120353798 isoform X2 [Nilaparvata lugens]|uniref:uncharacterized protein LOC120353798 isoform X2 n=1 Tax=Nilaparvata lugens TaxID=108931 RepID=UPI00193D843E|nr:uncharacterized protein LOC120353798 isoform X2 [Nilaparvata lugens]XP_039294673.1 uncharacterized protein LOC120353798 isoform X2 [Nilaparvata lugens]XP_039294674.1 uncharacterized protein LOC120353798 isoform X2 [Nilaparvata lugens]
MVREESEQNGLLSYENPNYHLDPARLDDALNSNTEEDPLYQELLEAVCQLGALAPPGACPRARCLPGACPSSSHNADRMHILTSTVWG